MATQKLAPFLFPAQAPLIITSDQISRYAELVSLISGLETQQKTLRTELLDLNATGAEQDKDSPYLLHFIAQERRNIDWKAQALYLAEKLYGTEGLAIWQGQTEQAAPVQAVTQIRVKPNPAFAAGLKPVSSARQ